MQSHDERDMESLAARRDREAVVKESLGEEIPVRYEGEELDAPRVTRLPAKRSKRTERKRREALPLGFGAGGGGLVELHKLGVL